MMRISALPLLAALLLTAAPLAAQSEPPRSELQALSYYLQQGDTASTEAELNRLRLKYPLWTPPQDLSRLSQTAPAAEIDKFYREIAARNYAAARATLAEAQRNWPDWVPPREMTSLLAVSEGQSQLDQALKSGDLRGAGEIVSRAPDLLRCDRVNNAWQLADGYARDGRQTQAFGLYQSIVSNCSNPDEMVATLEKADAVSSEEQLRRLVATASSRLPAEAPRFTALLSRLLAGRGVAAADAPAAKATAPAPQPRAAAPARSQAPTGGGGSGGGAALAAKNRGDWASCMASSAGSRSAAVQYQRAWCAYNLDQPMEAVNSFRAALAGRLSAAEKRDAWYGISLAYLKMGMSEQASQIAAQVDFTRSQRIDVERQILDQRGVAAYNARQYAQAIRYFNAMEEVSGGIRRDLAVLRAYAYLNNGDRDKARREFTRLHGELATPETRRGIEAAGE